MNKKITLAAVLLLLGTYSILPAYSEEQNQTTEEVVVKANKATLDKAQEAFDNKDFQAAIDYLTVYINSKPKKYEPYRLRGDAYYELRQYEKAEHDYQTAIDIKSADDKLMTGTKYVSAIVLGADKNEQLQNVELGNLYGRLMYAQKAQNDPAYATAYENAVKYNSHIYLPQPKKEAIAMINCPQKYGKKLNPQGIDADIYGAVDDIEKENYSQAIFKIQNITSKYPEYYLGYYLYGVALAGLEKDDEAISAFKKALKLNPNDFESLASLGQLYYSKAETNFSVNDAKRSVYCFNKALALNPNCYLYYFYIGLNELQMGNIDQAISNFDSALKLNMNDYNSMYYKLIAQYKKGDYTSVINGTTKLLYRHVSNYNSVLYLRALANTKSGNLDKALDDLNSIQNNIDDIYNADIKLTTDRDKALESYIYYLKSEIEHARGEGATADRDKAMQNPVIAQLSKIEKAMKPYKNALDSDTISMADYKKFEDFYKTSLPKMLQNGIVLNENDVENQYDYIRTTFDDLGLSFNYSNHEYRLSTIADYPYKKYSSKLGQSDLNEIAKQIPDEVKESVSKPKENQLLEQTPQIEMIADENKPSLAQMLASHQLPVSKTPTEQKPNVNDVVTTEVKAPDFKPETPDGEKIQTSSNIAAGEPFVFIDKETGLVDKDNNKNVKEILKEEQTIDIEPAVTENNSIKISAKEVKETPDIVIKYDEPKPKISEKHADINPEDFGVKPVSKAPEISESDEIVELSQKELMRSIMPELNGKSPETITDTTHDKVIASSFDGAKQEITNVKEKLTEAPKIVLPEIEQPINVIAENRPSAVEEVSVVIVPELRVPKIDKTEIKTEEKIAAVIPEEIPEKKIEPENKISELPEKTAEEKAEPVINKVNQELSKTEAELQNEKPEAQEAALELQKQELKAQKEAERIAKIEKEAQEKAQAQLLKEQEELAQKQKLAELKALKEKEKLEQQEAKARAEVAKQEQKLQQAKEKADKKAASELQKQELKAQKEAERIAKIEKEAQEKAQAQLLKEQEKAKILAEKIQDETKKAEEKAASQTKNEQFNAKIEALKQENERLKTELKTKKETEKIKAQAAKEQLRQERAQAMAEAKARKAAKDAELKAQAELQKAAQTKEKELEKAQSAAQKEAQAKENELKKAQNKAQKEKDKAEKEVKNVKEHKKFNFKNIFSQFKKTESEPSTNKTVIKSLEH